MALKASIQPVSILNEQAVYLSSYIIRYDLQAINCIARYDLLNVSGSLLYSEDYEVPENVLSNWGTDDKVIIQSIATAKNLTITGYPIEQPPVDPEVPAETSPDPNNPPTSGSLG